MNTTDITTWYVMGPIPILYEGDDEETHTQENGYYCGKPDCPCAGAQREGSQGDTQTRKAVERLLDQQAKGE